MGRPVAWLRELPRLRSEVERSRVETWARRDVERLFSVGRVQAQALMKAVGGLQAVANAHFVERSSLLSLLDELGRASEPEQLLRERVLGAKPAPRRKPLRVSLPPDLRTAMLPELPGNIRLAPGRIEITAPTAERMAESLLAFAFVSQNDDRWPRSSSRPRGPRRPWKTMSWKPGWRGFGPDTRARALRPIRSELGPASIHSRRAKACGKRGDPGPKPAYGAAGERLA